MVTAALLVVSEEESALGEANDAALVARVIGIPVGANVLHFGDGRAYHGQPLLDCAAHDTNLTDHSCLARERQRGKASAGAATSR
jgi:serine/threonine protein phosphatase PrpC